MIHRLFITLTAMILLVLSGQGNSSFAVSNENTQLAAVPAACTFTLSSTSALVQTASGSGSVDVFSSASTCTWTAASDVPWITITSGSSGTGNGTVGYAFSENTGIYPRRGTLTIGGNTFGINQKGAQVYPLAAKWGTPGEGDGQFNGPHGVAIDASGQIYVVDSGNNRVQKFDANGAFISKWGTAGTSDGQLNSPAGIAIDAAGYVYVVDSGNNRIQKFDPDGAFVMQWGTPGTGDGQFITPTEIAITPFGDIFIADRGNSRIQKFDPSGAFLFWWSTCTDCLGGYSPNGLAADSSGGLYAGVGSCVIKYDSNGNQVSSHFMCGFGGFLQMTAVALDSSGQLYASSFTGRDGGREEIIKSDPAQVSGEDRLSWGSFGSGPGQFQQILGLAVDREGNVYAADSGNNRIQKFAPATAEQYSFHVDAFESSTANTWLDTGIDLTAGTLLMITAGGAGFLITPDLYSGPDGAFGSFNGCPYGSLVGRIGEGSQLCVGSSFTRVVQSTGRLYLAFNDSNFEDNSGGFDVALSVGAQPYDPGMLPVYRFFNLTSGRHFFTIYEMEKDLILQNPQWNWQLVGTAFYAYPSPTEDTFPVYRFSYGGEFFFTIFEEEKDAILQNPQWGWVFDGVAFYAFRSSFLGTLPVSRFRNEMTGGYFFTISEDEKNIIQQNPQWGWSIQGTAFYGFLP